MSEDLGETRRGVSAADPEAGPAAREGPGAKRGRPAARPRGARLVDIAEAVGVHVSTVSRVLNGDPAQSVRPEVYRKILSTARQQGYRPNALARALKRRQTGAIAFVIPLLRNPIWVRLQRGALQRATDRGYVVMDEPGAVQLFLGHVAEFGHRRVALIDGPPEVDTVHRRVSAARRLCTASGIALTVRHAAATEDGGWEAMTRILRRGPQPTACGVGSLNQLFGVMAALRAAGVGVPGQMSVVSFDEDECLAFLEVPVTSVAMPLAELGGAAVDQLIARIERQPAGDVMIREPMNLLTRQSVARP